MAVDGSAITFEAEISFSNSPLSARKLFLGRLSWIPVAPVPAPTPNTTLKLHWTLPGMARIHGVMVVSRLRRWWSAFSSVRN